MYSTLVFTFKSDILEIIIIDTDKTQLILVDSLLTISIFSNTLSWPWADLSQSTQNSVPS